MNLKCSPEIRKKVTRRPDNEYVVFIANKFGSNPPHEYLSKLDIVTFHISYTRTIIEAGPITTDNVLRERFDDSRLRKGLVGVSLPYSLALKPPCYHQIQPRYTRPRTFEQQPLHGQLFKSLKKVLISRFVR